ncbi:MAG: hypothetical protein LBM62_03425 [Mediterranea sp.]|jgi:hypothetical protein|nr:hypothetical protein [Mediterranea sp.]
MKTNKKNVCNCSFQPKEKKKESNKERIKEIPKERKGKKKKEKKRTLSSSSRFPLPGGGSRERGGG